MEQCAICERKTNSYYVSNWDKYVCTSHYKEARKLVGVANIYRNKILAKDNKTYMTVYNIKGLDKEEVLIDADDIPFIKELRWHSTDEGYVLAKVNKRKLRFSKQGLVKFSALKLIDYIMFKNFEITSPVYQVRNDKTDCRKSNIRVMRGKQKEKSTIKHIL